MDGVYFENEQGLQVFRAIIPQDKDINDLARKIKTRFNSALKKRGLLDSPEGASAESFNNE